MIAISKEKTRKYKNPAAIDNKEENCKMLQKQDLKVFTVKGGSPKKA